MNLRKKMLAVFSASMLAISFMGLQVSAVNLVPSQTPAIKNESKEAIQPRKDKIDWLYKSVDGQLYRRLFNYSKNEWIGDWEIC